MFIPLTLAVVLISNDSLAIAALAIACVALVSLSPGRLAALGLFCGSTIVLTALFYALLGNGDGPRVLAALTWSTNDLVAGAWGGLRLCAIFSLGALAVHFTPAREILPHLAGKNFAAYAAGSLVRLNTALRDEAQTLREAQAVRGHEFRRGLRAVGSWIPLLVPLFVRSMRRAREQAYALHLAGLTPANARGAAWEWSTVVALAALAVAGRLALVALPNISLSYLVLFLAGVAYGPRVGFLVGIVERTAADYMLSGPTPFLVPWVLAEGLMGFACGVLGRLVNFGQRGPHPVTYATTLAATAGWMLTAAYSVLFDTTVWAFVQNLGTGFGDANPNVAWSAYIVTGLLFNAPAMVFNAAIFAVATYPILSALRAGGLQGIRRPGARSSAAAKAIGPLD